MTTPGATRNLAGIGWYSGALLAFAIMDCLIKSVSGRYDTWQIVFFRASVALLPIAWLTARSGGLPALRTRRPGAHALRALVSMTSMYCFFWGFGQMKLADAYALGFTAPLFLTALSVPLLGGRVGWRRWAAVAMGFAGVLVMLRPGQGVFAPAAPVVLAGAFLYALTIIFVRRQSATETNAAIIFYLMLTVSLCSGLLMLPGWKSPEPADLARLLAIGLVGGGAQIAFTRAFTIAEPAAVAPFEYTGMIWACGFGLIFFGEVPDGWLLAGAAIVIASGLYILQRETALARRPATG